MAQQAIGLIETRGLVALVEAAGRKQVTMLMPVVALILPVALVFAFFPGVVAIRNLS